MKRLLLFLLSAATATAITTGDVSIQVYNGSGFTPYYLSLSNGQLITKTAGIPAVITPDSTGSSSSAGSVVKYATGGNLNAQTLHIFSAANSIATDVKADGIYFTDEVGFTSALKLPVGNVSANTWYLPEVSGTIITTGNLSGITAVGTLASGSIPASLLTGTIATARLGTGTANSTTYLRGDGTWQTISSGSGTVTSVAASVPAFLTVTGSPITTSGTLAITLSGTALPVANGGTGITSFGTGIATWIGTPTSANLAAAITNETGTGAAVFGTSPTFTDSIIVNQSGQSQTGGIRVAADPANGANRAIFIVPPSNNDRVYIGASGQAAYALSFSYCSGFENFPSSVSRVGNLGFTLYGAGSFNLDADYGSGGRVNVSTTTTAGSLQINNTFTSSTNFEGLRLGWTSNVAQLWTVKGSGGGTARDLVLGYDSTERMRFNSSGVAIGANGTAFAQIRRYSLTMVAGTVTQADTAVTANTLIIVDRRTVGGTIGHISTSVSAGSSFTLTSSSSTETSTFTVTEIIFP